MFNERARATPDESLFDEATAARRLGVSPRTMADWRRRGSGPAYARLGRRLVRYDRADLDAFVAAGRVGERGGLVPAVSVAGGINQPASGTSKVPALSASKGGQRRASPLDEE